MFWLIEPETLKALEKAEESGWQPTAEQTAEFAARYEPVEGAARILDRSKPSAVVKIAGVLTSKPSFLAWFFGEENTTYNEIIQAVSEAEADEDIQDIVLAIDSPGGIVADSMFDAMAAISAAKKPVRAEVSGMGTSSAYGLAAQADSITAKNAATQLGSVGIVTSRFVSKSVIEITSTDAPKKRPDVATEEGRAAIREELDAIHGLFAEAIAQGRAAATGEKVTVDRVNKDYGQGAIVLALDAVKRGMIDGIAEPGPAVSKNQTPKNKAAEFGGESLEGKMDLKEMKANHPDVYAAAVAEGVNQERDRVSAHLEMGTASGDIETAHAAIRDGSNMTQALSAKYLAAGMNRAAEKTRADENEPVGASASDAEGSGEDKGAEIAALVEGLEGVKPKGADLE